MMYVILSSAAGRIGLCPGFSSDDYFTNISVLQVVELYVWDKIDVRNLFIFLTLFTMTHCSAKLMFWSSSDEDTGIDRTPEAVPGILKSWLQKLEESSELFTFKVSHTFLVHLYSTPQCGC